MTDHPSTPWPKRVAARYDASATAEAYSGYQQPGTRLWRHRRRETRIVRRFLSEFPRTSTVLDMPCGTGRYLPEISGFQRVLGIDGSTRMLATALRVFPSHSAPPLLRADALNLPLADGAIDLALCMRFLHHFESDAAVRACLRELARVTRGALICSFFDRCSVQHARRRIRRGRKHSSRFARSRGEMSALLDEAGFRVRRIAHVARWWSETCVLSCRRAD